MLCSTSAQKMRNRLQPLKDSLILSKVHCERLLGQITAGTSAGSDISSGSQPGEYYKPFIAVVILALLKQAVHLSSLGTQQLTDHLLMAHLEQKHSALSAIKPDSITLGFWQTRSQQEVRFSCCLPFLPDHVMSQCTLGNPGL